MQKDRRSEWGVWGWLLVVTKLVFSLRLTEERVTFFPLFSYAHTHAHTQTHSAFPQQNSSSSWLLLLLILVGLSVNVWLGPKYTLSLSDSDFLFSLAYSFSLREGEEVSIYMFSSSTNVDVSLLCFSSSSADYSYPSSLLGRLNCCSYTDTTSVVWPRVRKYVCQSDSVWMLWLTDCLAGAVVVSLLSFGPKVNVLFQRQRAMKLVKSNLLLLLLFLLPNLYLPCWTAPNSLCFFSSSSLFLSLSFSLLRPLAALQRATSKKTRPLSHPQSMPTKCRRRRRLPSWGCCVNTPTAVVNSAAAANRTPARSLARPRHLCTYYLLAYSCFSPIF